MGRALVIGGTTFMGYQLVWQLLAKGWQVLVLNRGNHADGFGGKVERLVVDRRSAEFVRVLADQWFDAVVDFACYNRRDAEGTVAALRGRVGHYVFISSGAAYLVRDGIDVPVTKALSEADYPGPLSSPPSTPDDLANWRYGAGKREAEDVFEKGWQIERFPATRVRLPIVNGLRDPERRLESYLWRIRDGGPLLLPDGGVGLTRHVYVTDVVRALASLVGQAHSIGRAYNFSQDEDISLQELVERLAGLLGAPARIVPVSVSAIQDAGLELRMVSPLSGKWASRLEAKAAKRELGFVHRPVDRYLEDMVEGFWTQDTPPQGYAWRSAETVLAKRLG
ncbi:NAD-dependent epimerase/dehydratase family protein [Sulfobacillus harzensis]|uniref:UDP-glucose 4-epimerase n=1 Tax=Sulfobacillus harzensis TaxID=2729629 RepID=A0A7Y0L188_9FIRM|nr:NAD-dependent epimerase/dehydratase family protein [Sulfobacillus harzensis]NMP21434.1 NAD-dependent epimerase/dehydratase family protein [Sulfobacillus harzensis]